MEKPAFRFTEPKKKKRKKRTAVDCGTDPFPVPIETLTGRRNSELQWNVFQGRLIGSSVIIESQNDMDAIYRMGFFGKGNLSWSAPEYNVSVDKDGRPRRKSNNETPLRILSKQRYLKHLEWRKCSKTQPVSGADNHCLQEENFIRSSDKTAIDLNLPSSSSSDTQQMVSSKSQSFSSSLRQDIDDIGVSLSSDLQKNLDHEVEHGDALVLDDSDDDDGEDVVSSSHEKQRNAGIVVFDPFPLKENLQLSLEESFFLTFGLGCLVVSHDKQTMNITTMWSKFSGIDRNFVTRYVAYHNFRSKGWVVKSGIKYGVDFNLYKKGPPFYHSTYSVLVVNVDGKTGQDNRSTFDWTSLCCLNRVTQQVSKELMICYVIKPKDLSDDELQSPKCISKFKVSEFIIGRWVSKKERENAEYLEIP